MEWSGGGDGVEVVVEWSGGGDGVEVVVEWSGGGDGVEVVVEWRRWWSGGGGGVEVVVEWSGGGGGMEVMVEWRWWWWLSASTLRCSLWKSCWTVIEMTAEMALLRVPQVVTKGSGQIHQTTLSTGGYGDRGLVAGL